MVLRVEDKAPLVYSICAKWDYRRAREYVCVNGSHIYKPGGIETIQVQSDIYLVGDDGSRVSSLSQRHLSQDNDVH